MELLWQDKISNLDRNEDIDTFISNSLWKVDEFRISIIDFVLNKISYNFFTPEKILNLIFEEWKLSIKESTFLIDCLNNWIITKNELESYINSYVEKRSLEVYILIKDSYWYKSEDITELDFSILIYSIENWILEYPYGSENSNYSWLKIDLENRFKDWNLDWGNTYEEFKSKYGKDNFLHFYQNYLT